MKGDTKVIESLNEILTAELTAINQYYVHFKMCANWGYARLAAHTRADSLEEMKHADQIIDRILLLDGVPNMQRLSSVKVGQDVPEQLRLDLDLELAARTRLNQAIALCRDVGDNGTRTLLESILADEEEGIDWLEAQLKIIADVGVAGYLAEQIHE